MFVPACLSLNGLGEISQSLTPLVLTIFDNGSICERDIEEREKVNLSCFEGGNSERQRTSIGGEDTRPFDEGRVVRGNRVEGDSGENRGEREGRFGGEDAVGRRETKQRLASAA